MNQTMMNFFVVFLGGGFGACCRFAISLLIKTMGTRLWIGTLMANLIGCLIFFLISKVDIRSGEWQLLLKVGILGSLTTFSTFTFEVVSLMKDGRMMESALVLFLNIFFGIIIGIWVLR